MEKHATIADDQPAPTKAELKKLRKLEKLRAKRAAADELRKKCQRVIISGCFFFEVMLDKFLIRIFAGSSEAGAKLCEGDGRARLSGLGTDVLGC